MDRAEQIYQKLKAEWETINEMKLPDKLTRVLRERAQTMAREQAMEARGLDSESNGINAAVLSIAAKNRLFKHLEHYDNILSDDHEKALEQMVNLYTAMSSKHLSGRWALPLATGCGKTSSIITFLAELHHQGIEHVSIGVTAFQIEQLCQLKREMMEAGIPEEKIGLFHTDSKASMPSTDDHESRQFMMVTHNLLRIRKEIDEFNTFKGKPRDFWFWDEALIRSEAIALDFDDLGGKVADISFQLRDESHHVLKYLKTCIRDIEEALKTKNRVILDFPEIPGRDVEEFIEHTGKKIDPMVAEFLRMIHRPWSVLKAGSKENALITAQINVPDSLENIVILDAGQPIRDLVELDKTIKTKGLIEFRPSYEKVTVHQLRHSGSRSAMNKSFTAPVEDQLVCKEVAELVESLDGDVLVFTFKDRPGIGYSDKLRKAMVRRGIDLSRVHILTWGQETSLNSYRHCRHVVLCGLLRVRNGELAAQMAGQMEDLETDITVKAIETTQASEMAARSYQALSRGSMRVVDDGKAQTMDAWIINDNDRVETLLRKILPRSLWTGWSGEYLKAKPVKKTSALAKEIEEALEKVTKPVIAIRQFKRIFGFETSTEAEQRQFTRALNMVLMRRLDWEVEKQSLVNPSIERAPKRPKGRPKGAKPKLAQVVEAVKIK